MQHAYQELGSCILAHKSLSFVPKYLRDPRDIAVEPERRRYSFLLMSQVQKSSLETKRICKIPKKIEASWQLRSWVPQH